MLNDENLPELLRRALEAKREEEERNGMRSGEGACRQLTPQHTPCLPSCALTHMFVHSIS